VSINFRLETVSLQLAGNKIVNEDPQFCGTPGSFYYPLQSDSPATAANSLCNSRIGAEDIGCQTTGTVNESWGTVKSLYR